MQFFSGSQHITSVTQLTRLKKETKTNTVLFHLSLKKLGSDVLDLISHSPLLHKVISQKNTQRTPNSNQYVQYVLLFEEKETLQL